jgi:hypothetical protein
VAFDAVVYEEKTKQQWEEAVEAGHPWGPTLPLGGTAAAQEALVAAGFSDVSVMTLSASLRLLSAAECVCFERESFGAPLQMRSDVPEQEREQVWAEIEVARGEYATDAGFVGLCEQHVLSGTR